MSTLLNKPFPYGRFPYLQEEEDRVELYWSWLEENRDVIKDTSTSLLSTEQGQSLVALKTLEQADYEALHMQHSIGYNFTHYSGFGDLYSIRSPENTPLVTLLVSKGNIIHYKEEQNASLSEKNLEILKDIADKMGWMIPSSSLDYSFDFFKNAGSNTKIAYFFRDPDTNEKTFSQFYLKGLIDFKQVEDINNLGGGFLPENLSLSGFDNQNVEIKTIAWTDESEDTKLKKGVLQFGNFTISDFVQSVRMASQNKQSLKI